ncbi:MAG: hypothetical protein AAFO04_08870 [Cyanobacteria bacterium J06592_8]
MNFISSYVFQVAVLSALAVAVGYFLQLNFVLYILLGFWASFCPSIGEGIDGGSKRLLGIGGGGFIGCAIMLNWSQNTLSIGIGLFLTILFCYAIGIPKSVGSAITSFCMVSIGHYSDGLNQYYWERFIENSIGVAFGITASLLLPPPLSVTKLQQGMHQILIQSGNLYLSLVDQYINPISESETQHLTQLEGEVDKLLANNSQLLQLANLELSQGLGNASEWKQRETQHRLIAELITSLKEMAEVLKKVKTQQTNQLLLPEVSYLAQTTYQMFKALGNFFESNLPETEKLLLPNLSDALVNLEGRIEQLHHKGESYDYELDQIIHFSAFLNDLRAIANQLNILSEQTVL